MCSKRFDLSSVIAVRFTRCNETSIAKYHAEDLKISEVSYPTILISFLKYYVILYGDERAFQIFNSKGAAVNVRSEITADSVSTADLVWIYSAL